MPLGSSHQQNECEVVPRYSSVFYSFLGTAIPGVLMDTIAQKGTITGAVSDPAIDIKGVFVFGSALAQYVTASWVLHPKPGNP